MARRRPNPPDPEPPEPEPTPEARRVAALNGRRRATLLAILERPTRPDIPWRDIEALFEALGGEVTARKGSRRAVSLNGVRGHFHEPHPERVTDKGAVESVRAFLTVAGFVP